MLAAGGLIDSLGGNTPDSMWIRGSQPSAWPRTRRRTDMSAHRQSGRIPEGTRILILLSVAFILLLSLIASASAATGSPTTTTTATATTTTTATTATTTTTTTTAADGNGGKVILIGSGDAVFPSPVSSTPVFTASNFTVGPHYPYNLTAEEWADYYTLPQSQLGFDTPGYQNDFFGPIRMNATAVQALFKMGWYNFTYNPLIEMAYQNFFWSEWIAANVIVYNETNVTYWPQFVLNPIFSPMNETAADTIPGEDWPYQHGYLFLGWHVGATYMPGLTYLHSYLFSARTADNGGNTVPYSPGWTREQMLGLENTSSLTVYYDFTGWVNLTMSIGPNWTLDSYVNGKLSSVAHVGRPYVFEQPMIGFEWRNAYTYNATARAFHVQATPLPPVPTQSATHFYVKPLGGGGGWEPVTRINYTWDRGDIGLGVRDTGLVLGNGTGPIYMGANVIPGNDTFQVGTGVPITLSYPYIDLTEYTSTANTTANTTAPQPQGQGGGGINTGNNGGGGAFSALDVTPATLFTGELLLTLVAVLVTILVAARRRASRGR